VFSFSSDVSELHITIQKMVSESQKRRRVWKFWILRIFPSSSSSPDIDVPEFETRVVIGIRRCSSISFSGIEGVS
jgi:hypothetical protein